jgi:hypothetical protein
MQVLISTARPSLLFFTISGSAKKGLSKYSKVKQRHVPPSCEQISHSIRMGTHRAMDTRSALPFAKIDSAVFGALMRFVAQSGIETIFSSRSFFVTHENAPRGTLVAMVAVCGIRQTSFFRRETRNNAYMRVKRTHES